MNSRLAMKAEMQIISWAKLANRHARRLTRDMYWGQPSDYEGQYIVPVWVLAGLRDALKERDDVRELESEDMSR